MKLRLITASAVAALVAAPALAGPPKPLGASGGQGGSIGANSDKAEDGARFDCYAIDTKRGEEVELKVKSSSFTPEVWIARGATCDSMAVQAQSEPAASGEASVKFKAAGGRYLVMTRATGPKQSGTYRIVVMHASDFKAESAEAGSPADSGMVADAGSAADEGAPLSAEDKRLALMNKQVAVRQAQLAEEARVRAEQEREYKRQLALAEERRRQQAAAAAAEESSGGGGLFGRALGGFLLGGMLGGGGSNAMDMAIAGAQAAVQGGNPLEVINSIGAASGAGSGGGMSSSGSGGFGSAMSVQPNSLAGSGACAGMNESNYREVGLSKGGDVQMKTQCAMSYEYYNNYKNAVAQGYSAADIQRAYDAHQKSAMVVQQFYNETHDGSGGGIQQDTHGPQASAPAPAYSAPSGGGTPCSPGPGSCVTPQ